MIEVRRSPLHFVTQIDLTNPPHHIDSVDCSQAKYSNTLPSNEVITETVKQVLASAQMVMEMSPLIGLAVTYALSRPLSSGPREATPVEE